jgi:hypothetical protein
MKTQTRRLVLVFVILALAAVLFYYLVGVRMYRIDECGIECTPDCPHFCPSATDSGAPETAAP